MSATSESNRGWTSSVGPGSVCFMGKVGTFLEGWKAAKWAADQASSRTSPQGALTANARPELLRACRWPAAYWKSCGSACPRLRRDRAAAGGLHHRAGARTASSGQLTANTCAVGGFASISRSGSVVVSADILSRMAVAPALPPGWVSPSQAALDDAAGGTAAEPAPA